MDMNKYYINENEKPLDNIADDGGFCGLFRRIGCVGDSLSSGGFQVPDGNGGFKYYDFYEYSWGQYIARSTEAKCLTFQEAE